MKNRIRNLFVLPTMIAVLCLISMHHVTAQTFTNLNSFDSLDGGEFTNVEGAYPYGGLVVSGNTLYGTATLGGSFANGTIFSLKTDGTDLTTLHSFTSATGARPYGQLVLSGNKLYGTANIGGSPGLGTVFAINTDGTGFTNLHNFNFSGGANPNSGLVLSGNTLYGSTGAGGSSGCGMVFALNTDGSDFTALYNFTARSGSPGTNSDGAYPVETLTLSGNTLYGTATHGGPSGVGTVFALNTNGTGFIVLHSFANADGANPNGLMLSADTLYGATSYGGSAANGTVFAVNTNGAGFTNLHHFTNASSEGAIPLSKLTLLGNTLYGTAYQGGPANRGAIFAVNTNGTGFTNLYSFTTLTSPAQTNNDGAHPNAGLISSGATLFGTAVNGGASGNGTIFKISLPQPPQLNIATTANQSVLFWPASATNYILQSTTNLDSPNWTTATDAVPVIAVTVTNSSPTRFFRLVRP
jgi:uncharacterized repeat protein (TIGR03803 family)